MARAAESAVRIGAARFEANASTRDPAWVKGIVLFLALGFFLLFLLMPLIAVFVEAFRRGWALYLNALVELERAAGTPVASA